MLIKEQKKIKKKMQLEWLHFMSNNEAKRNEYIYIYI